MSRIGIKPITLPAGISIKQDGATLDVSNGKLTITVAVPTSLKVEQQGDQIIVSRLNNDQTTIALHGTVRVLIDNAVFGLAEGWKKSLELHGSGYRAQVNDNELEMHLGYSHPITMKIPEGIELAIVKNSITVSGHDKQQVGQVAAIIRDYRKPEPYKGKGIRYKGEHIVRKVGKALKSTA